MPHHLDAASFLNTKTMCLITNYYKKLTLEFSYRCILHQSCTDGIETESQFLPHGQCTSYIFRGVLDIELSIVESIRHKCCRQTIRRNAQIREDRQHGPHAYLAISHNVVYE